MQGDAIGNWPMRPWLMAAIGAVAGLIFWMMVDMPGSAEPPPARQAAATFVMVGALAFLITAERIRLAWAAGFAVAWGLIVALIGFYTASYNKGGEIAEFPFLSALLAVGIAAPLFQVVRDQGRLEVPYGELHRHVWSDAIIGGASFAFTGLTFLMAFLLAQLFDAIGIPLFRQLLEDGWFVWMLAGSAFGAASATLREREPLLGTLQRLVRLVASILAPVLAAALALFLLALPATGFAGLWKSNLPETPLLLLSAAFAFGLLNAIIGDSRDERGKGRLWRLTELGLLLAVLPLGVLALISMGMRVDQYGWTPERLWGVIACLIAIAFGCANWLALFRGRSQFDAPLRSYQKRLAIGLCGIALLLALPVFDFGAISSRSQLARLEAGKVAPAEFDWAAMAFEFGPAGRRALERIAEAGAPLQRTLASRALSSGARYEVQSDLRTAQAAAALEGRVRIATPGLVLDERLRTYLARSGSCAAPRQCVIARVDANRIGVISGTEGSGETTASIVNVAGLPSPGVRVEVPRPPEAGAVAKIDDLGRAAVEVRPVVRKQLFVDGQPVGPPFE